MSAFIYNDGGRSAAGYKGDARDCVVRAITIATGADYKSVYLAINKLAGFAVARSGVPRKVYQKYLDSVGWEWVPTMGIGQGCTTHLCAAELPSGRLIVRLSRHVAAVIDGVIHDTHDPSRGGTRCVYGYFKGPSE